jgi:MFS family permease
LVTRPVALVAAIIFSNTFALGAFPVLLPDIGSQSGFDDAALGMLAGAFGFARLLTDIPAGLLLARHLRSALIAGMLALSLGNLCLVSGGPFAVLVLGRGLYGAGHASVLLACLLIISSRAAASRHGFSLNVFEFSGMLGMLLGMLIVAALPADWSWRNALLLASAPQLLGLALLPSLLREIAQDRGGAFGVGQAAQSTDQNERGWLADLAINRITVLAWTSGCLLAVAWAAVGQFILPLRAAREFELSRFGIALLLALPQVVDLCVLLPLGRLADRVSRARLLGMILLGLTAGVAAMAFGGFGWAIFGCALFGLGLAAWMLPVGLLGRPTSPRAGALRVSLHRTFVDVGVFFGPLGAGLLADAGHLWLAGVVACAGLLLMGLALLAYARREG